MRLQLALALTVVSLSAAVPAPNSFFGKFGAEEQAEKLGNIDERGPYLEGDILISENSVSIFGRAGVKDPRYRWPNREVVYRISTLFSPSQRQIINEAISELTLKTCIRFRESLAGEGAYVDIVNTNGGCSSFVGRNGKAQTLNLGSGCVSKGIIIHEFVHTIGFYHEQSRTDRDDYVTINYGNIQTGKEHNFQKYPASQIDSFGVSYDYGSIMHYSAYAFSKSANAPTISVKEAGAKIGQRSGLSSSDIRKINNMYDCPTSDTR